MILFLLLLINNFLISSHDIKSHDYYGTNAMKGYLVLQK